MCKDGAQCSIIGIRNDNLCNYRQYHMSKAELHLNCNTIHMSGKGGDGMCVSTKQSQGLGFESHYA